MAAAIYDCRPPVDLSLPPRLDLRAYYAGPVGWSAMHSGSTAQPQQQRHKQAAAATMPLSDLVNGQRLDKAAQREVVKFATTRSAHLPPTPPSTAPSSSAGDSTSSRQNADMEPLQRVDTASKLIGGKLTHGGLDGDTRRLPRRPFQQRFGRRYTRDAFYPLPCDVPELQRQNLRTSLACKVFGRPICNPSALSQPPSRVLELGCGTGFWSASCHQAYAGVGHDAISFTGMDIAPVAPDLRKQGVNWTFVQHDMRRVPWPFEDGSFDLIMWKDLSLVINAGAQTQRILNECIRVLRVGGTLEVWEYDNLVRCMQPSSPLVAKDSSEERVAAKTATHPVHAGTPFIPSRNRYLRAANKWINTAVGSKGLVATPCARMGTMMLMEPNSLGDLGVRRVAIPLKTLTPEQDAKELQQHDEKRQRSRSRAREAKLTRDQLSLRQTALLSIIQFIESLEPLLKEVSGKNDEEWSLWWTAMMSNLSSTEKNTLDGECLEIGAWWATKLDDGLR